MRNKNRIIALLLLSLAALNAPQATVLCIGDDGHVAIEPAGHNHNADGSHVWGYHENGDEHCHVGSPHGRSCTDIPIPAGVGDDRVISHRSKASSIQAGCFLPVVQMPDVFAAPVSIQWSLSATPFSCDFSLSCIILQV